MNHTSSGNEPAWNIEAQIIDQLRAGAKKMAITDKLVSEGMTRPAALEFSFFLSMPTMIVATGYDLLKTIRPHHDAAAEAGLAPLTMDTHNWIVVAIGFVVSFVVALGVVAWFMRWVRARGFAPFAIYRIVLGIVLLVLIARGVL